MITPGAIPIAAAGIAGFTLGIVFFGGLWLTVRALPKYRHPTLVIIGSFWGRTAFVLAGFVLAIDHRWQYAAASLIGFLIARFVLGRWLPHHVDVRRCSG